jgi:hypothetical protein
LKELIDETSPDPQCRHPIIEIFQPTLLSPPDPVSPPVEEARPLRTRFRGRLRKEVVERRDRLSVLSQEVIELKQKGVSTDEIANKAYEASVQHTTGWNGVASTGRKRLP